MCIYLYKICCVKTSSNFVRRIAWRVALKTSACLRLCRVALPCARFNDLTGLPSGITPTLHAPVSPDTTSPAPPSVAASNLLPGTRHHQALIVLAILIVSRWEWIGQEQTDYGASVPKAIKRRIDVCCGEQGRLKKLRVDNSLQWNVKCTARGCFSFQRETLGEQNAGCCLLSHKAWHCCI